MTSPNQFLIYKKLQRNLMKCTDIEKCIGYKEAEVRISYFRIPKKLIPKILTEMMDMGLIEKANKQPGGKLKIVA